MTMFGWNDSGGGTVLPRLIAKELTRRGWEVSVFHAATAQLKDEPPYTVVSGLKTVCVWLAYTTVPLPCLTSAIRAVSSMIR